jgi:probable HAF family extracellular repeat protein
MITTNRGLVSLACLCTAALGVLSPRAGAQTLTGLGFAPSGTSSRGLAISADGSAVVGYGTISANDRALRWTSAGGMANLGTLTGGTISHGSAISADGSVAVGYSDFGSGQAVVRAFRWTAADGMVSIGTLTGGTFTYGNGVSADGLTVVGYGNSSTGSHAFRWSSAAGMQDLGVLSGYSASLALAANSNGSVVVGYSQTPGARAFRWTSAGLEDLGTLNGGASYAYAVSADGSVVAGRTFSVSTNSGTVFRWTAGGGLEDLGTLSGDASAFAYGMNADGSMIVGMSQAAGAPPTQRAYLWTNALGMVDLNTYLPTLGMNLSGWTLTNAWDISPDGRFITGYGAHNGAVEAWLATLPAGCAADVGSQGGVAGADGLLNNNDFIVFINYFFGQDSRADRGAQGGVLGHDGLFDNNDFIVFINQFFTGC